MAEWKAVPGYEGFYEINRAGDVRTVARLDTLGRKISQHPVAQGISANGYPEFIARRDGKRKHVPIHRALLEAFVGPRPEGHQARHLDDNKLNYSLDNLKWGTRSENNYDRVHNGIHHYARRDSCSRGHLLESWNLYRNAAGRRCRSCETARSNIRLGRATGTVQDVADARYAELLAEQGVRD